MLKKIASRVSDRGGVIAIEASDPVAYVASQPDARTFVVELRDVVAVGFADNFSVDPRHPVAAVKVESAKATDGVNVARIRMTLTEPTRPRVRSARNVIYVEADRLDQTPAAAAGAIADRGGRGRGPAGARLRAVCSVEAGTAASRACSACAGASAAGAAGSPGRTGAVTCGFHGSRAPAGAAGGRATGTGGRHAAFHREPGQPRLPGRRPARGAPYLFRDQRPEHRHRPDDPGNRGRRAA